ncbi:17286_t:CDS:1 [Acaulospora morrowiae]|uniref:17286_t:CDS:1 n=1 Tax=Acaulospora morrowiae TaxID=94023 RepID=A0A9N8V4N5_9GLOM|nr:17286_t:CDS:1 [Acaulospora morrowiae]
MEFSNIESDEDTIDSFSDEQDNEEIFDENSIDMVLESQNLANETSISYTSQDSTSKTSTSNITENSSTEEISTSYMTKTSSPIWQFFDKNQTTGIPSCCICKMSFSKKFSTSTLQRHLQRRHLSKAINLQSKKLQDLNSDPYNENDQNERDNLLMNWIVCTQQAFHIVDNKYFRAMIHKLDS